MNSRNMRWIVTAAIIVLLGASAVFIHAAGDSNTASGASSANSLNQEAQQAVAEGTDMQGKAAPNFSLQDQTGATVSLASLRGRPVVLTFFDSVCPHADCSLMAQYLNWTAKDMGTSSADVTWVAISVDPWHDTPASATEFLQSRQVTIPFHFLLGTYAQLKPLWDAFYIQVLPPDANGVVLHGTGVYILDAQGRERLFLSEGFDPKPASGYLRVMLSQPGNLPAGTPVVTQAAGTAIQTQNVNGATVSLTARPAQFGNYDFIVEVLDSTGKPVQNATVSLALTMPAMAMTPLTVTLGPTNPPVPGAYAANGVLSMYGQWQVTVKVQPAGGGAPLQTTFTFTSRQ